MKRILILICLILLLGGCYDYYELNNLAIVVGIGIDYKADEYIITYEVISNNVDKESANTKSYTVTKSDKNFVKALYLTSDELPKRSYFAHTDLLVISEEVALNHLKDILDFLIRSNELRENLNVVVADDAGALLNQTSESIAVVSTSINDAIKADIYSGSYLIDQSFINMTRDILSFGTDTILSKINIKNDKIDPQGVILFHDYKMVLFMPIEESSIYNLLINKGKNIPISVTYNDKTFTTAINSSKIKIDVDENINITGDIEAQVIQNESNFNLKDEEIIKQIERTFKYTINEEIMMFIKKLQQVNSDVLSLGSKYYAKSREKNDLSWTNLKIKTDVEFNISKKGIIYEVQDAN